MDIRLVKQPAVFGNVQVGIEDFFFPNASYTDVYMYNETQTFYLHYAYIRTLTTKKPCEKFVFCVKRKKKTKLKIRRIPEINISEKLYFK